MSETAAQSRAEPAPSLLDRALDAMSFLCKLLAGISLVTLTVIFGWLVYGRYVLNATPTWVEQVSLLLIMVITFLGAAAGVHEGTHLGVEYFRTVASRAVRKAMVVVSHLMMALFGGLMAWHSWRLVVFKWDNDIPLINVPEGLRAVPIMLCGVLVLLFSIGHLIREATGRSAPSDPVD